MMTQGALALLVTMAACSTTTGPTCAKGSVAVDGKCIDKSASSCGEGTVWDEASKTCVLAGADASGGDVSGDTAGGSDAAGDAGGDAGAVDTAAAATPTCEPSCGDRVCGDDGCGGSCGDCPNKQVCDGQGKCHAPPDCNPNCMDKVCGDDGCGGSCGSCGDPTQPICKEGACLAGCVPDCVGKECGKDGCGGTCGACKAESTCSDHGHCVPKTWTCDPHKFGGFDGCDCGCGAPDPDCKVAGQQIKNCALLEVCDASGKCAPKAPKAWTCSPSFYDDGLLCHCDCGAPDPDCKIAGNTIADCQAGACDKDKGTCAQICTPSCTGKVCGDDGCGGTCGTCGKDGGGAQLYCKAGKCEAKCTASCTGKECGDDGCGGSCGSCKTGLTCTQGVCVAPADKSCAYHCGAKTSGGCWCDEGCVARGDCCTDVDLCFCTPDCKGKVCGSDGCGGSCGTCKDKAKPHCDASGQCGATCVPKCTGKSCGDDGCGGSCGACKGGESCNAFGKCVPPEWTCQPNVYATGGLTSACDCSCGAPDPDCGVAGPLHGCPAGSKCVKDKSWCDAKWCTKQADCSKPAWCVGDYPTADYTRRGVCAPPDPAGFAPGHPCGADEACATGLCQAGNCRIHCTADKDCIAGQACVGVERYQPLTGKPIGVVGICDEGKAVGKSCSKHSDCDKQLCLAFVDPQDLKLVARCGIPHGGAPEGVACGDGVQCELGLVCAGGKCARTCLGGQSECGADQTCKPAVVQHGLTSATSDDTTVAACHPKS